MRIQLRKFVEYNEKNAQREFYIIQFFDQKEEEKSKMNKLNFHLRKHTKKEQVKTQSKEKIVK